ncbi:MAG: hypothetical protein ACRDMU_02175 [Gaiellaceae bacterium]
MRARLLAGAARRPLLLVTALYALAAVVAALPAVLQLGSEFMSTGLPGHGEAASGDHLQTSYRFWLVGHQLEHGAEPWRDPYSFQPLVEPQVVLGGWPFGLPFWPLEAAFGPGVAWNLLLLAVTVAAGVLVYLWLSELALPPAAAALGGLAFAVAPYRLVQSGGHLLGWIAVLVPLALWAFERSRRAESRRSAHAWGALAAAALVSIPLSGQLHLALGALPFVAAYAAVRYARVPALWAWGGVLLAAGAGLLAEALVIAGSSVSEGRRLAEVTQYSASGIDFASRWRLHGLERFVYLGWLTPALALAGLVLLVRRGRPWLAALLALAVVVPAVLALGTNLPLYETLRDVFPPLRYPRVPGRFLPLAALALAALAAVAAAWLVARVRPGRRGLVAGLLLVLVAADLLVFPLRSSRADPGNDAYAALDEAPAGRVLELPVFERGTGQFGSVYQYYTLQAPRERPTGYALAPDEAFRFTARFNRLDCGVWLPGDRAALERLGIRYVLWHGGLYDQSRTPGAWHAWEGLREAGFRPAAQGGVVWLFEDGAGGAVAPVAEPGRGTPVLCDGWENGALVLDEGAVWLYGSGASRLELEAPAPTLVTVFVDGRPLAPRILSGRESVELELSRAGWHAVVVRGSPGLRFVGAGPA